MHCLYYPWEEFSFLKKKKKVQGRVDADKEEHIYQEPSLEKARKQTQALQTGNLSLNSDSIIE